MRCRKCGASIPTDSKFCNYCGATVNRMPTRDGSMPARPRDENFDDISTVREEKIEETENRGQRLLVILLIVLTGAVFAGGSVAVYRYLQSHQRTIINPIKESEVDPGTVSPTKESQERDVENTSETETYSEGSLLEWDGISYQVENGALKLIRCNATGAIVRLPEELYGFHIREIGSRAFFGCNHLQYIDIPEGVTTISDYAFSHCGSLREIVMPRSLTDFGAGVFDYTGGFTVIAEPDTFGYWIATNNSIPWKDGDSISVISE